MTPWLTLSVFLTGPVMNRKTLQKFKILHRKTVEEEEQEEVDPDSSATILDLSPGVNEITVEQEVEGEIVERMFLVHVSRDYDGTGSTPYFLAFTVLVELEISLLDSMQMPSKVVILLGSTRTVLKILGTLVVKTPRLMTLSLCI